jgi:hypothetical protein
MGAPRYEFSFEATPKLGSTALKCLLWKRGGMVGPIALILLPLLLLLLAGARGRSGVRRNPSSRKREQAGCFQLESAP